MLPGAAPIRSFAFPAGHSINAHLPILDGAHHSRIDPSPHPPRRRPSSSSGRAYPPLLFGARSIHPARESFAPVLILSTLGVLLVRPAGGFPHQASVVAISRLQRAIQG